MKFIKDNWNATLYDENHSFVSKYGSNLIDILNPKKDEKILDLGCGTGDLANTISNKYQANVLGVDKSLNMVEQAQQKYPHLAFIVQDATELDYENEFDAVFSNATLHWIRRQDHALKGIYRSLKPGGRFVAEFGGKGNVQIITDEMIRQINKADFVFKQEDFPWYFPSIAEYTTLMEKLGFNVTFSELFDRPTPLEGDNGLRNWINMFGDLFFNGVPDSAREEIITAVEHHLKENLYKDGRWIADYKRIRVIGVK